MNSETNIEIQALNFPLTLVQSRYVERRIDFALAATGQDIERIEAWLSDIHISEGKVLKRCLIHVQLFAETRVVADSTDLDLQVAIQRAAEQASRKVSRSVGRKMRTFKQLLPVGQFQPNRPLYNRRPELECSQTPV